MSLQIKQEQGQNTNTNASIQSSSGTTGMATADNGNGNGSAGNGSGTGSVGNGSDNGSVGNGSAGNGSAGIVSGSGSGIGFSSTSSNTSGNGFNNLPGTLSGHSGNASGNGSSNGSDGNELNEVLKWKMLAMEAKLSWIESQQQLAKLENERKWERSEMQKQKKEEEMANFMTQHNSQIQELKEKNGQLEAILKDIQVEKIELTQKLFTVEANFAKIFVLLQDFQKYSLDTQMNLNFNHHHHHHQEQMEEEDDEEDEDGGEGEGGIEEWEEREEVVEYEEEVGNKENRPEEEDEEEEDEKEGEENDEEDDEQQIEQQIGQQEQEEADDAANDESMDIEIIEPLENAHQPAATINRMRGKGRHRLNREYHFLKTVKSLNMLDNIRFKNNCNKYKSKNPLEILTPVIMPCAKKYYKEQCDFELLAFQSGLEGKIIHVYEHSQHNHPIMAEEKRAVYIVKKERLPDENPKEFYYTPDRIEWKFLQTLPNEEQMKKFCGENHCPYKPQSIRFPCNRKLSHNCKFMLLKLKTTQLGYHVYKHGEHNSHSAIDKIPTNNQKAAKYGKRKQLQMKEIDK